VIGYFLPQPYWKIRPFNGKSVKVKKGDSSTHLTLNRAGRYAVWMQIPARNSGNELPMKATQKFLPIGKIHMLLKPRLLMEKGFMFILG
jgi:hypothetical protein